VRAALVVGGHWWGYSLNMDGVKVIKLKRLVAARCWNKVQKNQKDNRKL
jgi:hypothetical protein